MWTYVPTVLAAVRSGPTVKPQPQYTCFCPRQNTHSTQLVNEHLLNALLGVDAHSEAHW